MILLGVNIDHVATLRQARGTAYPSPLEAALIAETAGADLITLHLREDRRHIQDADVILMRQALKSRMNLEMALTDEMLEFALKVKPHNVCFVPENRRELTTEGGLDVAGQFDLIERYTKALRDAGVRVSLFVQPDDDSVRAAAEAGANAVELHTGRYADAKEGYELSEELSRLRMAARRGVGVGLTVNAGHGLSYHNVAPVAAITDIRELNIGHAIVAQALFDGFAQAVREMKLLMRDARGGHA